MVVKAKYNYYSGNIPVTVTIEDKPEEFVLMYNISIVAISETTEVLLNKIKDELVTKTGIRIEDVTDPKRAEYVKNKFKETVNYLLSRYIPDIGEKTKDFLATYLMHKSLGLGKIELLLEDTNLEEVVINNASDPIWVYHHKFGWLKTNIMLENEDQIKHYAALIGRKVGRNITLLTPLLDAHLDTGERVNATLNPISTKGNTLTLRKFNVKPITITNMLQEKTISLAAASLIWAGIEYELSALVAGGTASGKTVLLNMLCSFFPPNQRIISVEDSVTRDCEIMYKEDGLIKKDKIGNLIDKEIGKGCLKLIDGAEIAQNNKIEIFSMDKNGKIVLKKPSSLIRHKVNKKVFNVALASGREIKVTEDHSLFNLNQNKIKSIKCSELKVGSFIATPRSIDYRGNKKFFDLTNYLDKLEGFMVKGDKIKELINLYGKELVKNKSNRRHYMNKSIMPVSLFNKISGKISDKDKLKLKILPKSGHKNGRISIPLIIKIDENFIKIIGMWLADGCYDKKSILISDPSKECWNIIREFADKFKASVKLHSDKVTAIINSKVLRIIFEEILELKGNAYTKKVPNWIFNLNKNLTRSLLRGYFSGDGTVKKHEICANSSSKQLLKDIQTLLLRFEIPLRISWNLRKDNTYESRISSVKFLRKFKKDINFTQDYKKKDLKMICKRGVQDVSDIIPLEKNSYLPLKHIIRDRLKPIWGYNFWKNGHMAYKNRENTGREYLKYLVKLIDSNQIFLLEENLREFKEIKNLATNDLFWDKVISIKEIDYSDYLYDLSVPGNESFICNNIVAHNTREIVLPKYLHWIPMVTREPNVEGRGEIAMLDLIINSLRMRPDRIVVGEIRRQREAETLFEAMHTGHSVYSTLHANDTQETLNRLLNPPINIPKSSLPAISMMIIMYRNRRTGLRRIFQISEVKRDSNAKVLMQYDLRQDKMNTIAKSERLMPELQVQTGFTPQEINQDLREKSMILSWLTKRNVDDVDEIGKIIATYYKDRNRLLEFIKK